MSAYSDWTLRPLLDLVGRRLLRRPGPTLEAAAAKIWDLAPGASELTPPAFYLPNQLERVTGWAFADEHPRRAMEGGLRRVHAPTRAFLLKDAMLVDSAIYANGFSRRYRRRSALPMARIEAEIDTGALYCTEQGLKWFGSWLMDDCLAYPLASALGQPVSLKQDLSPHMMEYEALQRMAPARPDAALIRDAIVFADFGQNGDKRERAAKRREILLAGRDVKSHPGVFILRGMAGERRILLNEDDLAQHLSDKRGFKVLNPAKLSVDELLSACAGAETVIGIEGSALMHGVGVLAPGGRILALQPPNRFVTVYKDLADRDGQFFGSVVGISAEEGFRIDPIEVEQTLDLFPPSSAQ